MKGLVLGTDYIVESGTGAVKVLEINTNPRTVARDEYLNNYDFTGLEQLISSGSFSTVHVIRQTFNAPIAQQIQQFAEASGKTFEEHIVNQNSITVPYIEDSDDVFIIRMSYDTTAVIDEDYAKDKFKLFRAISGSAISPKTYCSSSDASVDELTSLPAFTYSGDSPNFILKKRIPNYDKKFYPKCYKFENNAQLNDFIANSVQSDELLQQFVDSELNDGKRHINRSIDLVYGPELTPLSLGAYKINHIVTEDIWANDYNSGSWGELALKDRGKYITYYNSDDLRARSYIYDEGDSVLMADGSQQLFASCSIGDQVKSLHIPDLDLDETSYSAETWTGSYSNTLVSSSLQDTTIISKYSSPAINDYFIKITLDDSNHWSDTSSTLMLIKSGSSVKFKHIPDIEVGDEVVLYNVASSGVEVKSVTSTELIFKEEQVLGTMDVEPYDLFLPFVHNDYTILQHNPCQQPNCAYNTCNPGIGGFQGNRSCNQCSYAAQCLK